MRKYGLWTTIMIANLTKRPVSSIRSDISSGRLVGQKVAGTYVFWDAVVTAYHMLNGQWNDPANLETVYSINGAAKYLGIDSRRIRALADGGDLDHYIIDTLGPQGWAMVFAESDLSKVDTSPLKLGPKPIGDEHVGMTASGERYEVVGTHDGKGRPFSYRSIAVARRRAREAYQDELPYKKGDSVLVRLNTKTLRELYGAGAMIAVLIDSVTHIDRSVVVEFKGNRHVVTMNALVDRANSVLTGYCGTCKRETVQYWKYTMPSDTNICSSCHRTQPINFRRDENGRVL